MNNFQQYSLPHYNKGDLQLNTKIKKHKKQVKYVVTLCYSKKDSTVNRKYQQSNKDEKSLQRTGFIDIQYTPIFYTRGFFLPFDFYIETEVSNKLGFQDYKQIFQQYRQVHSTEILKFSNRRCIQINMLKRDCYQISDYHIIYMLNSLGQQKYHNISLNLQQFYFNLDCKNIVKRASIENKINFGKFIKTTVKEKLSQVSNQYYIYSVTNCFTDMRDAYISSYGLSESFVNLLRMDLLNYQKLILREGFFDITNFSGRNDQYNNFITMFNHFFKVGFENLSEKIVVEKPIKLLTLDGKYIQAKVQSTVYPCFGQQIKRTHDGRQINETTILGYLYIGQFSFDYTENIDTIYNQQQNQGDIFNENCDLLYPQESLGEFFYHCQTEQFQINHNYQLSQQQ